jgi:hypothetical protein
LQKLEKLLQLLESQNPPQRVPAVPRPQKKAKKKRTIKPKGKRRAHFTPSTLIDSHSPEPVPARPARENLILEITLRTDSDSSSTADEQPESLENFVRSILTKKTFSEIKEGVPNRVKLTSPVGSKSPLWIVLASNESVIDSVSEICSTADFSRTSYDEAIAKIVHLLQDSPPGVGDALYDIERTYQKHLLPSYDSKMAEYLHAYPT